MIPAGIKADRTSLTSNKPLFILKIIKMIIDVLNQIDHLKPVNDDNISQKPASTHCK